MSDTPKKLIVDLSKGTQEYVELTAEEIQQRELDAIEFATREEERKAEEERVATLKESAKAKLIAGKSLTGDEAAVLVI
jgi:phage I-like protein